MSGVTLPFERPWFRAFLLASFALLAACERTERPPPQTAIAPESRDSFFHFVVDDQPPGGELCCTDIAALGDINADGYLDLVIGSEGDKGAGLVWYEYPHWQKHEIARGAFTTDGHAVDFDGDGDLDVLVGEIERGVMWFEQRTDPADWIAHEIGPGYAHDLAVGDLDGDRDLDVAVADKKGVHVYSQDGNAFRREEILARAGEGLQASDIDADGDLDLLYANTWIENDRGSSRGNWIVHDIDAAWTSDTRIQTADIDADGKLDIVLSGSEGESGLAWFKRDDTSEANSWTAHEIGSQRYVGVHSLQVADIDLDGDLDIVAAEMGTSPEKRVFVHLNEENGARWRTLPLAAHGSHNMVVGDVDRDGDVDLFGKNYDGEGRFIEYWENRSSELSVVPQRLLAGSVQRSQWEYQPIDLERPASDARKFGLLIHDVNRDGRADVVAGGSIYLQPTANGEQRWRRIVASAAGDIIHVVPLSKHGWPLMLAIKPESIDLIEASSSDATQWKEQRLHRLPAGRTQGFTVAPSGDGRGHDLYFTHATSLFRLRMTGDSPSKWPLRELRDDVQEEAVVTGDLDGNGALDLLVVAADGKRLFWLIPEQKGVTQVRTLGASLRWIDRVAIADLNTDGRLDIVYTEETGTLEYDARLVWLEAPSDPRRMPWTPHTIVTLRSLNSLGVHDIDADGRPDLIVAEHTDITGKNPVEDNFTGVFHNAGSGTFQLELVEIGPHSSHLGAVVLPKKHDEGSFDIVSVGWEQTCCVHRWRRLPQVATTTE